VADRPRLPSVKDRHFPCAMLLYPGQDYARISSAEAARADGGKLPFKPERSERLVAFAV
jgi:hypothetical protein